ncbi:MAG: hypothetical protein J07HN4v3_01693 [Halonotius sp. J07HN4]|jgi:hypothetical protein|nr:MAG: hypothetical protein J07HN4v3_01693 [Halonotius sp. J07HN4]
MSADDGGFGEGVATSDGDLRVLLGLNAILSTLLGWTIVGGLSIIDVAAFSLINVATAAIVVFALTYAVTMR